MGRPGQSGRIVNCRACGSTSEVVDSRKHGTWVWRRRRCQWCKGTWQTREVQLTEVKNSHPPTEDDLLASAREIRQLLDRA